MPPSWQLQARGLSTWTQRLGSLQVGGVSMMHLTRCLLPLTGKITRGRHLHEHDEADDVEDACHHADGQHAADLQHARLGQVQIVHSLEWEEQNGKVADNVGDLQTEVVGVRVDAGGPVERKDGKLDESDAGSVEERSSPQDLEVVDHVRRAEGADVLADAVLDEQHRGDVDAELGDVGAEDEVVVGLQALAAEPSGCKAQDQTDRGDGEGDGGRDDDFVAVIIAQVGRRLRRGRVAGHGGDERVFRLAE
ncbi:hypothetical protein FH972_021448 [Carpinus fangiana]|uniref:Uncharacterized protein n=1 Tax=Carpinus fangiana TaxID=176857 RepID=A0A5N6KPR2_9ROSI|nr:hypothetical protein FH972_021448 [Carpinus fangiana]